MPGAALLGRPRRGDRSRSTRPEPELLFPMDHLYRQSGLPVPSARRVDPVDIPPPFRTLLVHEQHMTFALEEHWGPVILRVLGTIVEEGAFFRRVVLAQEYTARPVIMGALRIDLDAFERPVRTRIVQNRVPFGRVLREAGIQYRSRPRAFFSVVPNSEMLGVFWMREPRALYGRRTEMLVNRRKVGDVVEILAP
jgi:chorismate-pyruvate lyase